MDEAGRLVSELHNKLAELDQRVWNYRRDMAAEFARYTEDLLNTVPHEISETVSKIISEDLKDYPSLNPDAPAPLTSGVAGSDARQSSAQPRQAGLMPSFPYNTARDPEQDSPRGLHEREHDFQGLFTPSYLPLLDYTSRPSRPGPLLSPISFDKGKAKNDMEHGQDEDTHIRTIEDTSGFDHPRRPVRRNTDETSIASDRSDGQVRRSALRRASDSSKVQSPRRVRFDVMGEEVLPTASPQHTASSIDGDGASYYPEEDTYNKAGLEQSEDMEYSPPQKRKVSTTDALRARSRLPLEDDNGQWITVSAGPDGEPVEQESRDGVSKSNLEPNTTADAATKQSPRTTDDSDDADTVSDDGMTDMPPLSPMRGKKASPVNIPPSIHAPIEAEKATNSVPSPAKRSFGLDNSEASQEGDEEDLKFLEDDEDHLFRFDESGYEEKKPEEEEHAESDSDSDSGLEISSSRQSPADPGFSRSPALDFPSRLAPRPSSDPNAPSASKLSSAPKPSVGSYKGHPFNLPIVSEELHAQAASLGAFNSFVGSLSGRSGVDPSDVQSFKESLHIGTSFTGEPKSMTERLMMEDFIEAEKEKAAKERAAKQKSERERAEGDKAVEEKTEKASKRN